MEDDGQASLSPQKLLQFALDVAKGMQHLAAYGASHCQFLQEKKGPIVTF